MQVSRQVMLLHILALCIVHMSIHVYAQERYVDPETQQSMVLQYRVGAFLGLQSNLHQVSFGALPGFVSCCSQFESTTSWSPSIGAMGEYTIKPGILLDGRLGFSLLSANFSRSQVIGNEPVLTDGPVGTPDLRTITVEHTLGSTIAAISLEPTVRIPVEESFSAVAGIRAGFLLGPSFEQQETLVSPEGYVFTSGSAIRNQQSGAIPTASALQLHAIVGGRYDVWKSTKYAMGVDLRYGFPITKIADVPWSVHTITAGISITMGIYEPVPAIEKFDTLYVRDTATIVTKGITSESIIRESQDMRDASRRVADTMFTTTTVTEHYKRKVPRPFDPGLSVSILGRNADEEPSNQSVLRIEEMDVIESYPMLPQIFFAEGVSSLAQTGQSILDSTTAAGFSTSSLSRKQLDVYRNLLNIIGQRMSLQPEAKITVSGYVSNAGPEQSNRELSRARAEAVKAYLTSTWHIESNRIAVKAGLLPPQPANSTTPDGKVENQRIEIAASDLAILEPVEFRDRDLTYTPKFLVVRPNVQDAEEITSWSSALEQGGRQLAVKSGQAETSEYLWDPVNSLARPRRDQPLIATYTVRNAAGTEKQARDTLAVDYVTLQMIRSRQEEGKMIERYSLIVFDFNSAQLSPANQRTMEKVKARIQPESKVRIVGYADRTGNPDYNRSLANRRCLEAQRVLDVANDRVTIVPIGSDTLIYDNETPEGRSYSRTVQIEIETPIK